MTRYYSIKKTDNCKYPDDNINNREKEEIKIGTGKFLNSTCKLETYNKKHALSDVKVFIKIQLWDHKFLMIQKHYFYLHVNEP